MCNGEQYRMESRKFQRCLYIDVHVHKRDTTDKNIQHGE